MQIVREHTRLTRGFQPADPFAVDYPESGGYTSDQIILLKRIFTQNVGRHNRVESPFDTARAHVSRCADVLGVEDELSVSLMRALYAIGRHLEGTHVIGKDI
jgi:hypothetical protein